MAEGKIIDVTEGADPETLVTGGGAGGSDMEQYFQ
jgi:hypothetical protein